MPKLDASFGAIVVRDVHTIPLFLLIKHIAGHWSFPKGHPLKGETNDETAKREVFEETGIKVSIAYGFKESIDYIPKPDVCKTVFFFMGIPKNFNCSPQPEEVAECSWLSFEDAFKILTYEKEKVILKKAFDFISDNKGFIETYDRVITSQQNPPSA